MIAAFVAVYLIWGSTYLAIRVAVETLPPFLMAGARFLLAGLLLYGWTAARGASRPGRRAWIAAAIVGALLLLGGNGGVVWAEQRVPSSITALLVASEPLWIVLLDWLRPGGKRPQPLAALGVLLGFGGVALLIGPAVLQGSGTLSFISPLVIVLAALCWAAGSLYARSAPLPASGAQASAMQMLIGGFLLLLAGLGTNEMQRFASTTISLRSALAVGYLVIFGSLGAFTAYAWLVTHTTATRASTYAYVNPVVAVLLGWALLSEPVTPRTLVAAAIIIGSVVIITLSRPASEVAPAVPELPSATEA
ncbi:MAG: EamA family transporter [Herpetosiphonaceae bacterium]|nr:EamA family transporter [Herpetosiphonaceae bacterium]